MWKKKAVLLWRIRAIALYILLCTILFPLTVELPSVWLALTLITGSTAMVCAYIRHYLHAFSIQFRPNFVEIHTGVFIHRSILVPAEDLIFTDIRSTPIERKLGLCRVRIYGRGKTIRVPCLPRTRAEKFQRPPEVIA